jgi:hypothetical protein
LSGNDNRVKEPHQSEGESENVVVLRPPLSVRLLAMCILVPVAAFFAVVAVGAILQSASNWPSTLIVLTLACVVGLLAVHTWRRRISAQDHTLIIYGLRRRQMPLSTVAEIRMTPSRSYPRLLLVSFIGTGGQVLFQLPPIWDLNAVASWAEGLHIPFARGRPA